MESGIYLVTLLNEIPISVNAHDPRIAHKCIKVDKTNCKIGKAKILEERKKNYFKTFKEDNVNFRVLAKLGLSDIKIAEKAILTELDQFRIRGSTGRANEWLQNICPDDAIRIVVQILKGLESKGHITIHDWGINPANY